MRTIESLITESHATAVEKGWWNKERSIGDVFANFHSELSEAWEEYRRWGMEPKAFLYTHEILGRLSFDNDGTHKPEGIAAEFADVLIRIADTCGKYNIPLAEALEAKLAFNKTRSYRHGNKIA